MRHCAVCVPAHTRAQECVVQGGRQKQGCFTLHGSTAAEPSRGQCRHTHCAPLLLLHIASCIRLRRAQLLSSCCAWPSNARLLLPHTIPITTCDWGQSAASPHTHTQRVSAHAPTTHTCIGTPIICQNIRGHTPVRAGKAPTHPRAVDTAGRAPNSVVAAAQVLVGQLRTAPPRLPPSTGMRGRRGSCAAGCAAGNSAGC